MENLEDLLSDTDLDHSLHHRPPRSTLREEVERRLRAQLEEDEEAREREDEGEGEGVGGGEVDLDSEPDRHEDRQPPPSAGYLDAFRSNNNNNSNNRNDSNTKHNTDHNHARRDLRNAAEKEEESEDEDLAATSPDLAALDALEARLLAERGGGGLLPFRAAAGPSSLSSNLYQQPPPHDDHHHDDDHDHRDDHDIDVDRHEEADESLVVDHDEDEEDIEDREAREEERRKAQQQQQQQQQEEQQQQQEDDSYQSSSSRRGHRDEGAEGHRNKGYDSLEENADEEERRKASALLALRALDVGSGSGSRGDGPEQSPVSSPDWRQSSLEHELCASSALVTGAAAGLQDSMHSIMVDDHDTLPEASSPALSQRRNSRTHTPLDTYQDGGFGDQPFSGANPDGRGQAWEERIAKQESYRSDASGKHSDRASEPPSLSVPHQREWLDPARGADRTGSGFGSGSGLGLGLRDGEASSSALISEPSKSPRPSAQGPPGGGGSSSSFAPPSRGGASDGTHSKPFGGGGSNSASKLPPDSLNSSVATSTTATTTDATSSAPSAKAGARPFLKKGARMPRSGTPGKVASIKTAAAVAVPKGQAKAGGLRLQPSRSSSAPAPAERRPATAEDRSFEGASLEEAFPPHGSRAQAQPKAGATLVGGYSKGSYAANHGGSSSKLGESNGSHNYSIDSTISNHSNKNSNSNSNNRTSNSINAGSSHSASTGHLAKATQSALDHVSILAGKSLPPKGDVRSASASPAPSASYAQEDEEETATSYTALAARQRAAAAAAASQRQEEATAVDDCDLDLDLELRLADEEMTFPGLGDKAKFVRSHFVDAESVPTTPPTTASSSSVGAFGRGRVAEGGQRRNSQWEGTGAYSALYGSSHANSAPKGSGKGGGTQPNSRSSSTTRPRPTPQQQPAARDDLHPESLGAGNGGLEQQMKKYEREAQKLKSAQAQAEQAERDFIREREKLWKEVEAERRALHAEFDAERNALRKERRRLTQVAERQRQQTQEERDAAEERKRLQERNEQLEEEAKEKDKRWQRTVERLQRQVGDLTKRNQELQEEVRRANHQAQLMQQQQSTGEARPNARQSTSVPRGRGRSGSVPRVQPGQSRYNNSQSQPHGMGGGSCGSATSLGLTGLARGVGGFEDSLLGERGGSSGKIGTTSIPPRYGRDPDLAPSSALEEDFTRERSAALGAAPTRSASSSALGAERAARRDAQEVREVKGSDGRTERTFADGRREVEFSNGLRKVMWPDGRTTVLFQNGDRKEIHADGVVVYHYSATGAVQTTLADGTELYQFVDGQFERHGKDGSKEIRFPNGTTKQIASDGSEEICFADGTVRKTGPASSQA